MLIAIELRWTAVCKGRGTWDPADVLILNCLHAVAGHAQFSVIHIANDIAIIHEGRAWLL
jgi:hypothetical protein